MSTLFRKGRVKKTCDRSPRENCFGESFKDNNTDRKASSRHHNQLELDSVICTVIFDVPVLGMGGNPYPGNRPNCIFPTLLVGAAAG